ncbi:MAG: aminotransferase class I/II-fold pyridoxal phosphate-dependent enzyme [Deltaproteobacteria bacterium]|nr:aminotransferase class I/II-fold pyridoxal phosphate-dependent enzyme [Deltaproteobacteria bacterium]MBM4317007.1 aminotransferase class I/II-fold pyridoxal phosphate-dependent enzyme [Deltaproteobacteria bacterium]
MNWIQQSKRLQELPPYIFSEINAIKADAQKRGVSLLSLAIGDPDQPTPELIVRKLQEATSRPENHVYSPYEGTQEFKRAVARWFHERFNVKLNADTEVLALIGSKEGIAHFPIAFVNPGDKCLYPSPGYPIFQTAISLAGGIPIPVPHRETHGFIPNLDELESLLVLHRPKYLLINFPSNPTSAVVNREFLTELVFLARKYETILVSDNAYSEMYYDERDKPLSILEIPGAMDLAIEFQSFSKTFNMTGWRIAYAAGNAKLIAGLLRAKTNIDSGPLLSVQQASIYALENALTLSEPIRELYRKRKTIIVEGLDKLGIQYLDPRATFFLWAKVPTKESSMEFAKRLIEKEGLVVTPGIGFGKEGEGYFRLALTVPNASLEDAIQRLGRALKTQ